MYRLILFIWFLSLGKGWASYEGCPISPVEWEDFRAQRVKDMTKSFSAQESQIALEKYAHCYSNPKVKHKQKIAACSKNFLAYGKALIELNPISQNQPLMIPDDPKSVELPKVFYHPKMIEGVDNLYSKEMNEFSQILKKEYPKHDFLIHLDEFIKTNTAIIRIPGKIYDKYYHLSEKKRELLAIIIEKETREGVKLSPAHIYFRRYSLPKKVGGDIVQVDQTETHCYQCHTTGPIGILNTDHESLKVLNTSHGIKLKNSKDHGDYFNYSLSENAYVVLKGFKQINKNLGPKVGQINPPSRTLEFLKQCSSRYLKEGKNYQKDLKVVKEAMNCMACHNGKDMSALHVRSNRFHQLLRESIVVKHMPGHMELSELQSKALYDCLMKEYFGGTRHDNKFVPPNTFQGDLAKFLFNPRCRSKNVKTKKKSGRQRSRYGR